MTKTTFIQFIEHGEFELVQAYGLLLLSNLFGVTRYSAVYGKRSLDTNPVSHKPSTYVCPGCKMSWGNGHRELAGLDNQYLV